MVYHMFVLGSDRVTVYHVLSWVQTRFGGHSLLCVCPELRQSHSVSCLSWVETGFRGDSDEIHRTLCVWTGLG